MDFNRRTHGSVQTGTHARTNVAGRTIAALPTNAQLDDTPVDVGTQAQLDVAPLVVYLAGGWVETRGRNFGYELAEQGHACAVMPSHVHVPAIDVRAVLRRKLKRVLMCPFGYGYMPIWW